MRRQTQCRWDQMAATWFDDDNLFFAVIPTAHTRTGVFGIRWVAGLKTDTERFSPVRFPHDLGAGVSTTASALIRIETVGSKDTYIKSDLRYTESLIDRDWTEIKLLLLILSWTIFCSQFPTVRRTNRTVGHNGFFVFVLFVFFLTSWGEEQFTQ